MITDHKIFLFLILLKTLSFFTMRSSEEATRQTAYELTKFCHKLNILSFCNI